MRNKKVLFITKVAIFSALSVILYCVPGLQFPIPVLFPPFLKIQFSLIPAILCGFLCGPLGGISVVAIKFIVNISMGSDTGYVGEFADLAIGVVVCLSTSLIYHKIHSRKGGIIALCVGCACWCVTAVLLNWLVLAPLYIQLYFGGSVEAFVGVCKIIKGINPSNYMLLYLFAGVLPFNIVLSILNSLVCFLIYKRTSYLFKKLEKE